MFFLLRNSTTENFNEISSKKCSDIRFCKKTGKCKTCRERLWDGECDQTGDKCMKTCGTCNGKCKDKLSSKACKNMKKIGKCWKDKNQLCLMTCYNCGLKCKDLMPSKKCKKKMKAGKCENKKIAKNCKKTCGICDDLAPPGPQLATGMDDQPKKSN